MKPLSALRGIAMAALLAATTLVPAQVSAQSAYEANLPPEINTSPALCDYVPCKEVLPGATSFSERKGQPPYVEATPRKTANASWWATWCYRPTSPTPRPTPASP